MVQFFQLGPTAKGRINEEIGRGIGAGVGNAFQELGQYKQQRGRLQQALSSLDNMTPEQRNNPYELMKTMQGAFAGIPGGERYIEALNQGIKQQRLQSEQGVLARAIKGEQVSPQEMGNLSPESQIKLLQQRRNIDVSKRLEKTLLNRGYDPESAKNYSELYQDATEGGKTAILNSLLDREDRDLIDRKMPNETNHNPMQQSSRETGQEGYKWPEIPKQKGLKPSDMVKREGDREKTNIPLYNEATQKLKGAKDEGMSIKRMIQLNDSGKLPSGAARLFLDPKTGELAFPAGTNPETQLFVKTLNDFTTKAKDSYGSRVTNFDLDQFMKRLPSLANTTEGRRLILKQMETINKLNALDSESIKAAYDHYGVGRINAQQARMFADQYKAEKEKPLLEEYENLGGLLRNEEVASETMPEKGFVRMQNPENGEIWDIPDSDSQEALKAGWTKQ